MLLAGGIKVVCVAVFELEFAVVVGAAMAVAVGGRLDRSDGGVMPGIGRLIASITA